MSFIAIDHTHPDHHKHTEFATLEEAQTFVETNLPNGFAAPHPGGNSEFWIVDKVNKKVSFDQKAYDANTFNENMIILRQERDRRLVATDITVLPDRWESMNNDSKTAWSVYRQALRDLPANTPDPTNITWPTKP